MCQSVWVTEARNRIKIKPQKWHEILEPVLLILTPQPPLQRDQFRLPRWSWKEPVSQMTSTKRLLSGRGRWSWWRRTYSLWTPLWKRPLKVISTNGSLPPCWDLKSAMALKCWGPGGEGGSLNKSLSRGNCSRMFPEIPGMRKKFPAIPLQCQVDIDQGGSGQAGQNVSRMGIHHSGVMVRLGSVF